MGIFLYFCENDIRKDNTFQTGIDKKVLSQVKAFNNSGIKCNMHIKINKSKWYHKIFSRLPFFNCSPKWKADQEMLSADFIYLRRTTFFSTYTIKMFKKIKSHNAGIKILVELPTYPYDAEYGDILKNFPFILKDKHNRKKLHKYVDRIVTLDDSKVIFGIETLKIANGIDFESIKERRPIDQKETINLVGVGMFADWHGYDRIIKGLGEYYKNNGKRRVVLHLVGEGQPVNLYKDLVKYYNIEEYVKLHGLKYGEDLDRIYDSCDIGIASLGCHRKGINLLSDLKSREYLAKGLPMIISTDIDVFRSSDFPYYIKFPEDDSLIDINKIIMFYDDIYKSYKTKNQIVDEVRKFAKVNIDVSKVMEKVIDYLKATS